MANACQYNIRVVGKEENCKATMNVIPSYGDIKEVKRSGNFNGEYELVFTGNCKWGLNFSKSSGIKKLTHEEIEAIEDGDYWGYSIADISKMLDVAIECNTMDIDEYTAEIYGHYNRGKVVHDKCREELRIHNVSSGSLCTTYSVKFTDGRTYIYKGSGYDINDLVKVEGKQADKVGKIVQVKQEKELNYLSITEKIGHLEESYSGADIERIWKNLKERKAYLTRKGLDEHITKKKYLSFMEAEWTKSNIIKSITWKAFVQEWSE